MRPQCLGLCREGNRVRVKTKGVEEAEDGERPQRRHGRDIIQRNVEEGEGASNTVKSAWVFDFVAGHI